VPRSWPPLASIPTRVTPRLTPAATRRVASWRQPADAFLSEQDDNPPSRYYEDGLSGAKPMLRAAI
jgi:hypothetical protein